MEDGRSGSTTAGTGREDGEDGMTFGVPKSEGLEDWQLNLQSTKEKLLGVGGSRAQLQEAFLSSARTGDARRLQELEFAGVDVRCCEKGGCVPPFDSSNESVP